MKKIILLVFVLFVLCKTEYKSPEYMEILENFEVISINNYEYLVGNWILETYVDTLKYTYSPFIAQQSIENLSNIVFSNKNADTNIVNFVWNLHEGTTVNFKYAENRKKLVLFYVDKKTSTDVDFATIEFTSNEELIFYKKEKNEMLIFHKMPLNYNLDDYLNELLVRGKYLVAKDQHGLSNSDSLVFTTEGEVIGFKDYKRYKIWKDFYDDIPQRDLIVFYDENDARYWYAWEKKRGIIKIYEFNIKDDKDFDYESKVTGQVLELVK